VLGWLWIDVQAPMTWLAAYFLAGLWVCVPFAVITSWPWLGHMFQRARLAAVPEEFQQTLFLSSRHHLTPCAARAAAGSTTGAPSFEAGP